MDSPENISPEEISRQPAEKELAPKDENRIAEALPVVLDFLDKQSEQASEKEKKEIKWMRDAFSDEGRQKLLDGLPEKTPEDKKLKEQVASEGRPINEVWNYLTRYLMDKDSDAETQHLFIAAKTFENKKYIKKTFDENHPLTEERIRLEAYLIYKDPDHPANAGQGHTENPDENWQRARRYLKYRKEIPIVALKVELPKPSLKQPKKTEEVPDEKEEVRVTLKDVEQYHKKVEEPTEEEDVKAELQKFKEAQYSKDEETEYNKAIDAEFNKENTGENGAALEKLKKYYLKRGEELGDLDKYKRSFLKLRSMPKFDIALDLAFWEKKLKYAADYPTPADYQKIIDYALQDEAVKHTTDGDWILRGTLPSDEKPVVATGRLNVNLDRELLRNLDQMIKNGVISGYYELGQIGTVVDATKRNDAISIYFLKEPTKKALDAISALVAERFRGENLPGKKVSNGFYLAEVGYIGKDQTIDFLKKLNQLDPELTAAIDKFLLGSKDKGMSEMNYFATKSVLDAYGYDLAYGPDKGIEVEKR